MDDATTVSARKGKSLIQVNTKTKMFNHLIKIAPRPADGFTGQGAAKIKMKCHRCGLKSSYNMQ